VIMTPFLALYLGIAVVVCFYQYSCGQSIGYCLFVSLFWILHLLRMIFRGAREWYNE